MIWKLNELRFYRTQVRSLSVIGWLTDWRFGDLTDLTLAGEHSDSILVNDLYYDNVGVFKWVLKILKLKLDQEFETQVWSILWSWILVKILRLRFRQYLEAEFEAKVWSRFWLWSLVEILKMKFGRDFEAEILFVKLNFDHPVVWHKASTLVRALNPFCDCQCLLIMMKPNFRSQYECGFWFDLVLQDIITN